MVPLLKNNSATGVYLLIDVGGWVAANAPGDADLGSLVLGSSYIYFDDFITLEEYASTPNNDSFTGWKFIQDGTTYLKTKGLTGQAKSNQFLLTVHVTSTQQANFVKFFDTHQSVSTYQLYLVRQWASETFKQFSYNTANKNYAHVCLVGYSLIETNREGKDVQVLKIMLMNAWRQNTP
jgi:hypothetical protein